MQGSTFSCYWILSILVVMPAKISSRKSRSANYRQVEKKILDRILLPWIYNSQIRPLDTALNESYSDESTKVDRRCENGVQHLDYFLREMERQPIWIYQHGRKNRNPDCDRKVQGVDAGHILQEREGCKVSWDYPTLSVCEGLPRWGCPVQHTGKNHFPQVSLTLACPMNLYLLPKDTQTCHLTIATWHPTCSYQKGLNLLGMRIVR